MSLRKFVQNSFRKGCATAARTCIFVFSLVILNTPAYAEFMDENEDSLTVALLHENAFWSKVVLQDIIPYSDMLSDIFQENEGSYTYVKDEYITALANSGLATYSISNPVASRVGDTIVLSYNFSQTGSTNLPSGPSISVWQFQKNETVVAEVDKLGKSKKSRKELRRARRQESRGKWRMVSHSAFQNNLG